MKIALLNDVPMGVTGSGGVEHHVAQLAEGLRAGGHEVRLITRQSKGISEEHEAGNYRIPNLDAPPLRKHPVQNLRDRQKALERVRAILKETRPDVIHVHNLLTPSVLRELRKHAPVVKSIHDCRPFCVKPRPAVASRLIGRSETFCDITLGLRCFGRCYLKAGMDWQERLEAWTYFPAHLQALHEVKHCTKLVVYSEYLKSLALRVVEDASKLHVVALFTDFESTHLRKPKATQEPPIVLFVGRLSEEKGLHHLFRAAEQLAPGDCELVMAGDGPLRPEAERMITRLSPRLAVSVRGYVDRQQLRRLYQDAALLVLPSIGSEGCPLSGIEALYHGTPVVGYDVGGIREWLVHGHTGILVPRGDTTALAAGVRRLLADADERRRLGEQGHEYVREKFQKSRHIEQLLAVYAEARRT